MKTELTERLERITYMETLFDRALSGDHSVLPELEEYYHSPLWLADYEADEAGLLPPGLKRGVLSEDGVYHLLTSVNEP